MVKTRVPINSVAVCPLHPHLFATGGGDAIGAQAVPPVTIPPFIAMQVFLCKRPVELTLECKSLLTSARQLQCNGMLQTACLPCPASRSCFAGEQRALAGLITWYAVCWAVRLYDRRMASGQGSKPHKTPWFAGYMPMHFKSTLVHRMRPVPMPARCLILFPGFLYR